MRVTIDTDYIQQILTLVERGAGREFTIYTDGGTPVKLVFTHPCLSHDLVVVRTGQVMEYEVDEGEVMWQYGENISETFDQYVYCHTCDSRIDDLIEDDGRIVEKETA